MIFCSKETLFSNLFIMHFFFLNVIRENLLNLTINLRREPWYAEKLKINGSCIVLKYNVWLWLLCRSVHLTYLRIQRKLHFIVLHKGSMLLTTSVIELSVKRTRHVFIPKNVRQWGSVFYRISYEAIITSYNFHTVRRRFRVLYYFKKLQFEN